MEPPAKRQSREAFDAAVKAHLDTQCMKIGDAWYCKKCKGKIMAATCYVSLHTVLFETCAGGGEVEQKPIPYCKTCEGEPKENMSCVHE